MGFRKIFACLSIIICACVSVCEEPQNVAEDSDYQKGEVVVYKLETTGEKIFEEIFLMSSQINVVYENAVHFLHGMLEFSELQSSIDSMKGLVYDKKDFDIVSIGEFLDVLNQITHDFSKNASAQDIETMMKSLSGSYKNVVNELNNYIN